jgi:hypothetical protein
MHKTNLMATAMLAFGLGGFTGVMLTNDSKMKLEIAMIEEFQFFQEEMKWDLQEGLVDTNYAEYYISLFKSMEEELMYKPEEERYYHE